MAKNKNKRIIKFSKTKDVKFPSRGTSQSAGIDFYVPELTETVINEIKEKNPDMSHYFFNKMNNSICISLLPNGRILIPSGIRVLMESTDVALIAHNKSGVGSKLGLDKLAEVVDSDYQGEIHINVVNTGNRTVNIESNQKLIQFLEMPIFISEIIEENNDTIFNTNTERGNGGFGHTDNK